LKRANENSLVLGDELCAGTESISALSIFSSSVIKMEERKTSFIFATHLHELCNIPRVMALDRVKMFHLKVIFNQETDMLIYDRKLEPGNGPAMYGLEVCRAMKMEPDFLLISEEIRKDLMGVKQRVLDLKQSKYNAKVFVHVCEICGKDAEDVHHIKFQCTADMNKMIDGAIQKDTKSNLVPLCKDCHNSVHHGGIDIFGFKMTSNGVALDWVRKNSANLNVNSSSVNSTNKNNTNENNNSQSQNSENDEIIIKSSLGTSVKVKQISKKKYSDEQINTILEIEKNHKTSKKAKCEWLEKNHSIKISPSTYNKIIKGEY
jgi:DNA mismatch repair protein MutS